MMKIDRIDNRLEGIKTVAISGHIRPDGDCIGSCLGMKHYLEGNFPQLERVDVYLEETPASFGMMDGITDIIHSVPEECQYDLFLALDSSDCERLGEAQKLFHLAKKTICYDHHISNMGFADENYIDAKMSSASELVFYAMDPEKISDKTAAALYMGIVHDSGMFQYSSTTPETMETAAFLMRKGFDHNKIIDATYVQKSYKQNRLAAEAMLKSKLLFEGKGIISGFDQKALERTGATHEDLNGIISQLRNTIGVEVAVLIHEDQVEVCKVSMRSKAYVDVSKIAGLFGGGGHVRAAGCTIRAGYEDACRMILSEIEKQI